MPLPRRGAARFVRSTLRIDLATQRISYFDGQRIRRLDVQDPYASRQQRSRPLSRQVYASRTAFAPIRPEAAGDELTAALRADAPRLQSRFRAFSEARMVVAPADPGAATVIPTETVAIDQARKSDVQFLRRKFGLITAEEGSHGKILMRVPDEAEDPVQYAAGAALALHERGGPSAAHPNFLRVLQRPPTSLAAVGADQWALYNDGTVGVASADVDARAAWTVTRGRAAVRVAILDEGIDTAHVFLAAAVVAERDFVDNNPNARPDGDDAHGTACAGIVASRDDRVSGLAPGVSLVAARIAKSDAQQFWIFDDFRTADAIDWCWDDARADVLSNSWGGGPPAPVITRAFARARTRGRGGKGAVIVIAAGNDQGPVSFPGTLDGVCTVGASNQWDKRKTRSSQDGEDWWGSNFGPALDLMAPGVAITTTDISGRRGYSTSQITRTFNGTSAATPYVAAAAGLMLSVNPKLREARVRELLRKSADPMSYTRWHRFEGRGRLNAYSAVRAAQRG